jgi:hypothetical protein
VGRSPRRHEHGDAGAAATNQFVQNSGHRRYGRDKRRWRFAGDAATREAHGNANGGHAHGKRESAERSAILD